MGTLNFMIFFLPFSLPASNTLHAAFIASSLPCFAFPFAFQCDVVLSNVMLWRVSVQAFECSVLITHDESECTSSARPCCSSVLPTLPTNPADNQIYKLTLTLHLYLFGKSENASAAHRSDCITWWLALFVSPIVDLAMLRTELLLRFHFLFQTVLRCNLTGWRPLTIRQWKFK